MKSLLAVPRINIGIRSGSQITLPSASSPDLSAAFVLLNKGLLYELVSLKNLDSSLDAGRH